jgi:predicted permease
MMQDVRYALRSFRKAPVFTAIVVLSLALGIGANTAIFTLTDQILLRLLPVRAPRELVQLENSGPHVGSTRGDSRYTFSYPMYVDLRARAGDVLTGVMARFPADANIGVGEGVEVGRVELVSGNYFEVLGVGAAVGRTFSDEDNRNVDGHPVVVLGYRYWRERFKADPGVVGRKILVNNHPMTVIGVSEEGFQGIDGTAPVLLRVPMAMKKAVTPTWDDLQDRRGTWAHLFGRLKPGVTLERAKAKLAVDYHNLLVEESKAAFFVEKPAEVRQQFLTQKFEMEAASRGFSDVRGRVEKPLRVLSFLVALVLLIACANVAGLLLARAAARRKEIAVRLAMGAGRLQLLRQLLTESVLLALGGGVAGVIVSVWSCDFLLTFLRTGDSQLVIHTTPDARILGFTALVSILTGMVFGFVPAWQATRVELADTLKDQTASVVGGRLQLRLRKGLVVVQVALSLVLLIGAGLFVRSLANLQGTQPGFQVERLSAFTVDPSLLAYDEGRRMTFFRQLHHNVQAVRGVESAALTVIRVLANEEWDSVITVEGYARRPGEVVSPFCNAVSKGYFKTLGMPMLAGRDFDERDAATGWKVAIVNRSFAEKYFGTVNAVGRRIEPGGGLNQKLETIIIGVVADAKYESLRAQGGNQVFWPYERWGKFLGGMQVVARTTGEPELLFPAMRAEVSRLDPNLPVKDMRTLSEQLKMSLVLERMLASLAMAFSLLATLLASLGLYGVLAFVVQSRTREIGIRMALGAEQAGVAWMVVRDLLMLVCGGAVLGLVAAVALTRFAASTLFGVQPLDPASFGAAVVVLGLVAAAAGLLPALRAARIDPIGALRYE